MTIIMLEKNTSPTIHWMCYIITTFLTKSLLQEESSIYKNMLHQKPKAYAVHFFQRGCCTQPQMLDYEGGKHIAPHTYIGATTYAVHFFQRGCFAHHRCWITKAGNTKPRIRNTYYSIQLQLCNLHYTFLPARLLYTATYARLRRRETHSNPHIGYWCNSLCCTFLPARLLSTPTASELRRQEKHSPPHIYCWSSLRCTFLPARLLSTSTFWITKAGNTQPPTHILLKQPPLYISCRETTQHTHRFWITKAGNTQPPTHILLQQLCSSFLAAHFLPGGYCAHPQILDYQGRKTQPPTHILLKQPTLYISSSEATQHTHRFWITKAGNTQPPTHTGATACSCTFLQGGYCAHPQILDYQGRKHTAPPHIYCWSSLRCTFLPARLLSTPISSSEGYLAHPRFWITKAGNKATYFGQLRSHLSCARRNLQGHQ